MTDVLLVLGGWLAVAVLAAGDRRLAGTWVTPFTVFAVPMQVVLTLTVIVAPALGFLTPVPAALAVLLAGPIVFWCGEAPVLAHAGVPRGGGDEPWTGEDESRRAVFVVSWVLIAIMALAFWRALRGIGTIGEIVQVDFQERFQEGASGFARPVAMLLVVYWIGATRRWTRREVLTLAALLALLLASFVKGTVLLPLAGGLLYRAVAGRMRLTVGRVAAVAAGGFGLVFGVYLAQTVVWGLAGLAAPDFGAVLGRRVIAYLFSGILGFSGTWQGGILPGAMDWSILVSPAWNLLAHLGGFERVANVPAEYLLVDLRSASTLGTSNVRTLFGTLWTFAGPLGAVVGMLGLGLGLGVLFAAARRSRNAWLLVVSSFLGAALMFGWFEYYFWHAFWYITVPLGLLAAAAVRLRSPATLVEGVAHQ